MPLNNYSRCISIAAASYCLALLDMKLQTNFQPQRPLLANVRDCKEGIATPTKTMRSKGDAYLEHQGA